MRPTHARVIQARGMQDDDATAYQAEDAAEEDSALYAWEAIYERPWEKVEQASDGTLLSSFRSRYKTRRAQLQPGVKRAGSITRKAWPKSELSLRLVLHSCTSGPTFAPESTLLMISTNMPRP